MLHLRVVAPPNVAPRVLEYVSGIEAVTNVIHLRGASLKPVGDVVLCDVAREEGSIVVAGLRDMGIESSGSIAIEAVEVSLSEAADEAEHHAAGSAADAVLWEEVEARTSESAEPSVSFLMFMVLATLIAAVGILTDSVILVIGAMVVGPEFGPLAGVCVAVIERRGSLALHSLTALALGFPVAIAGAWILTTVLLAFDVTATKLGAPMAQTSFIAHPDVHSAIVAVLAGIAGMLSLTTSKSGALIGVLISVTTIPAAAYVGVAAAQGNLTELFGALRQLGLNLGLLFVSGIGTLGAQRLAFVRRLNESVRRWSPRLVATRRRAPKR